VDYTDPVVVTQELETSVPEHSKEAEVFNDSVAGSAPSFKCDQCNYTNINAKGLGQHKRMRHRISQLDGNNDSEDEITKESNHIILELDDMGDIVGPKLSPNTLPPDKVFHPKAGMGIVEEEPSTTSDGDTYINYFFPDDPKTYIVTQGPNRGMRTRSIYNVFLRE
jgi:hypothetical protein